MGQQIAGEQPSFLYLKLPESVSAGGQIEFIMTYCGHQWLQY